MDEDVGARRSTLEQWERAAEGPDEASDADRDGCRGRSARVIYQRAAWSGEEPRRAAGLGGAAFGRAAYAGD